MSQLRLLGSALRLRVSPAANSIRSFTDRSLSTVSGGGAAEGPSPIDPFLKAAEEGVVYGRLSGIGWNTVKTDIIHFFEGCNLSTDNVKFAYNRGYNPTGVMLQFPSGSSYDMATRQIIRKGRLYRLEKVTMDHLKWDEIESYDGKAVLLEGLPRNALQEDMERFLSGCNFDPSSFQIFLRRGDPDPVRVALVKFAARIDAMSALCTKNLSFCLNNPISMRVLQ